MLTADCHPISVVPRLHRLFLDYCSGVAEAHSFYASPQETGWQARPSLPAHWPELVQLLAEQNPFLVGEATDIWVKERKSAEQDGPQALADFTAARKELLGLLEGLADEWSRPARHAIFGPTMLQEQVGFMAAHDRAHVQQVWKTLPGRG